MTKLFITIFFVITYFDIFSRKLFVPIEVIAGSAQLIVTGNIEEVKSSTYIFRIEHLVKGSVKTQTIEVQKFKEWTCDIRFAGHTVGQKLFLFLNKDKKQWYLIDGGPSERPIINDSITIQEEQFHIKGEYHPWKIKYSEFLEAIKSFSNQYKYKGVYELFKCTCTFIRIPTEERNLIFIKTPFALYLQSRMNKSYYKIINKN